MKFSSILIVTYGRTGSTLLMGVLNSIPGVLVRGENMNLCLGLFAAYQSLRTTRAEHGRNEQDSTKPFFGAENLDEKTFLADARALLRHQLVPAARQASAKCWGFKEIRYTGNALRAAGPAGLGQYLDFLAALMPSPAFIFLTRDHAQVVDSAFWKNREQSDAMSAIEAFEQKARKWSAGRRNCFWLDYASMTAGAEEMQPLFAFLGADFEREAVRAVMSREHSYAGKSENLKGVQKRLQDAREAPRRRTTPRSELAVDILPSSAVEHVAVEVKRPAHGARLAVQFGGVVVIKKEMPEGARLMLNSGGTEMDVQWGLPSPRMARQFPENPRAAAARYRVEFEQPEQGGETQLYLVEGNGSRHCLAVVCGSRSEAAGTRKGGQKR